MMWRARQGLSVPLLWPDSLRNRLQQSHLFAELMSKGEHCRVGVSACHAGAGATTVAFNLAVMLYEQSGQSVVLVDGNVRSPALTRRRSRHAARASFAESELDGALANVAQPESAHSGLSVLSLLPAVTDTLTLPMLRAAAERLPRLGQGFSHVVVDLPPVLNYPDAALLGAVLDGVVLVIEAEATRWQVAREATKRLEASGVRVLGVVLNKKPHDIPDWLYRLL